jgi:polysaccharide export outer membrane protein
MKSEYETMARTRTRARAMLVGLVAAALGCTSWSQSQPAQTGSKSTDENAPHLAVRNQELERLLISNGDLLDISVYGLPDMAGKFRVNTGGDISVPLVKTQHVAGLTADQAERQLEKALVDGNYVKHPHVTVLISEYSTQGVAVGGEVQKPGVYPIQGRRRLQELIDEAGGFTNRAGRTVTINHHASEDKPQLVVLSKDPAKALENNVAIYPGDTIVVSTAGIVYVVGDVVHPSGFAIDKTDTLTVLQAIALAEGTKPNASLNKTRLIRKTDDGPHETPIRLKEILAGKENDPILQPNDILFVPDSAGKSAAKRSMEAILQVATGVAIYRPPF